jgi:ubiquinone/menaquinone biosynthesis C-methylase UbiE
MNEFDIKAAGWDANPMHWDRSAAIAKEIIKGIPLRTDFRAIEFGAGTGILSFLLKDHLKEILLLDNSSEMIRLAEEKISSSGAKNLKTKLFDLEHSDLEDGKFDLIFTQMVLHHVSDVNGILAKFHTLLNPGGYLAIADLYPEDGSFHGPETHVHMGFDTGILKSLLQKLGFKDITSKECFIINRKISDNETRPFQVFIMIGKRID